MALLKKATKCVVALILRGILFCIIFSEIMPVLYVYTHPYKPDNCKAFYAAALEIKNEGV
jgi:hypothetical protein